MNITMRTGILDLYMTVIASFLLFAGQAISQDETTHQDSFLTDIQCLVDVIDPPLALNKTQLEAAETIKDLNPYYKPSWVRSFNTVELITTYQGESRKSIGKDDRLTTEQKEHLKDLDDHSSVIVRILYIPENELSDNEEKEIKFTIPMSPDQDAAYPDSDEVLYSYLKEVLISEIPERSFKKYQLGTVKFTVDVDGHIIEPKILFPTENNTTDSLMLHSICNMPLWTPAQYESGLKVRQEYALNVGSMQSCIANLVNTRSGKLPPE